MSMFGLLVVLGIVFVVIFWYGVETVFGRVLQHYVTCEECGTYIFRDEPSDVEQCTYCGTLYHVKAILDEERNDAR